MISYTDADDTTEYMKIQEGKGDNALEAQILKDVRELFPEVKIPKPLFFRSHPWTIGATYWLPGNYSPLKESHTSWSLRQAWVEGALEQAELCLKKIKL